MNNIHESKALTLSTPCSFNVTRVLVSSEIFIFIWTCARFRKNFFFYFNVLMKLFIDLLHSLQ